MNERKVFDAKLEIVPGIMSVVAGFVEGFSERTSFDIKLACEEILVNIASYAYPDGDGELALCLENDTENRKVRITFEDSGIPFNPLLEDDPDLGVPMAERNIGGLGIMMVRKRMDCVEYAYSDGKNILTLTKDY